MYELMNPSVPILPYLFAFPKDALTFLGLFPSLKNVSELNFFILRSPTRSPSHFFEKICTN